LSSKQTLPPRTVKVIKSRSYLVVKAEEGVGNAKTVDTVSIEKNGGLN